MLDNLSPLSNSTSALLGSWIWSECSHGYFTNYGLMEKPQPWLFLQSTFPQTSADIIAHLFLSLSSMKWKAIKLVPATLIPNQEITISLIWFCNHIFKRTNRIGRIIRRYIPGNIKLLLDITFRSKTSEKFTKNRAWRTN